jgi:hypothetical protein
MVESRRRRSKSSLELALISIVGPGSSSRKGEKREGVPAILTGCNVERRGVGDGSATGSSDNDG